MPTFHFTSPEGKEYEIDGPEGATQEQAFAILQQHMGEGGPKSPDPKVPEPKPDAVASPDKKARKQALFHGGDAGGEFGEGVGEAALSAVSGLAGSAAGGLAGLGHGAVSLVKGEGGETAMRKAAETSEKVKDAVTYEPRSEAGKDVAKVASMPMQLAKDLAGGGLEKAGALVGPKTAAAGRSIGEAAPDVAATLLGGAGAIKSLRMADAAKVPVPGKDFSPLRDLKPEEATRMGDQTAAGIKPTLGSVTRDPAQIRFEQQNALRTKTEGGSRLAQRSTENDQALTASLEKVKQGPGVRGATEMNETETGQTIRTATEGKRQVKLKEVDDLYDKARASGETKAQVDLDPLNRWVKEHKAEMIGEPKLKAVGQMIDELNDLNKPKGGWKNKQQRTASIEEIEGVRKRLGQMLQGDGSMKHYAGQLRDGIDTMTDGAGGDLYKSARKARKDLGDEFEEQAGNARIIDKKSRTDYDTAVEDVWSRSVVKGSTEDLRHVIDQLRTDKPRASQNTNQGPVVPPGEQAFKQLQSQTVNHLVDAATQGDVFSPAAFRNAVRKIGVEKLEMILGKDGVDAVAKVQQNAKDIKTQSSRAPGSDTHANASTAADEVRSHLAESAGRHLLSHFGMPGRVVGGVIDAARAGSKERAATRAFNESVDDALTPRRAPAAEVRRQGDEARSANRRAKAKGVISAGASPYLMSEAAERAKQ